LFWVIFMRKNVNFAQLSYWFAFIYFHLKKKPDLWYGSYLVSAYQIEQQTDNLQYYVVLKNGMLSWSQQVQCIDSISSMHYINCSSGVRNSFRESSTTIPLLYNREKRSTCYTNICMTSLCLWTH